MLKEEFDRADNQTTNAAVDAILRINLRDSCDNAILALFELQTETIASDLLVALFAKSDSLDTAVLIQGIEHRSSAVRRVVVELLRRRGSLDVEIADQFTSDSDAYVRFEALLALSHSGRQFSDNEAKNVLVKSKGRQHFGFLGEYGTTGNYLVDVP